MNNSIIQTINQMQLNSFVLWLKSEPELTYDQKNVLYETFINFAKKERGKENAES